MVRLLPQKVAFFKACVAIVSIWSDGTCNTRTALRLNISHVNCEQSATVAAGWPDVLPMMIETPVFR
jgi:hypothetical protein